MTHAIVLGAGMVGSVIAADLAGDPAFRVTVADARDEALSLAHSRAQGRVKTLKADLSDPATVRKTIEPFDIVLGALSSRIGFQTLRTVLEASKHYCDISFMSEDALALDALAKKHNVTALVDFGVAPGMSNLLSGHADQLLNPCEEIAIYVGGLPRLRSWPFDYKAAFSPADVLEEYTRPSRIVEHGKVVVRPALSEPELLDLPGVGTVEAFNTDGLRSLASTLRVPNMKEKTLRYPGHIDLMRAFRETGLFSNEPIIVKNADDGSDVRVRPIDLTSTLLFPKWTYQPGEEDLTVMRVEAVGSLHGQRTRLTWDLLDFYDKPTGFTSMARTTAFPAAIAARLIASGRITARGVLAPELLGHDTPLVHEILTQLERRGVRYTATQQPA